MNELERAYQALLLTLKSKGKLSLHCRKNGLKFTHKTDQDCFDCWTHFLDPELLVQFEHRGQCIAKHCLIGEE